MCLLSYISTIINSSCDLASKDLKLKSHVEILLHIVNYSFNLSIAAKCLRKTRCKKI